MPWESLDRLQRDAHARYPSRCSRGLRVLCYHALSDLAGTAVAEYGIHAATFARQLRILRRFGFRFVSLDDVLRSLDGGDPLPRRAVLLTFDDCYRDLIDHGLPLLRAAAVPAVAFAVADQVGGVNAWDARIGAPELPLVDVNGLRELERSGIEIGCHSRTHRWLPTVPADELADEVVGAADRLESMGLNRPRVFAYPFGGHDRRARDLCTDHYSAAFTIRPGFVREPVDRTAVHRVMILRKHGAGVRFLFTVATAGQVGREVQRLRRALHRRVRARLGASGVRVAGRSVGPWFERWLRH